MVGWQRQLQSLFRQAGKKVEHTYIGSSANFNTSCSNSSLLSGRATHLQGTWDSSSANMSQPFYQFLQQMGISSSRNLLADSSDLKPVSSPLTPLLTSNARATESQKAVAKPATVQAILKCIKQSPKKVNLVAALVRGMRVEDALLQLQVTIKRASKTVYQVIHSARANATHNYGLDPDRLLIAEAFVGKGNFQKRISYHARGKCGIKVRPECRLTIVIRETTSEEEAEIAKLRVHNFKKLTKRQRQLVPHKLIETTPVWNRKPKGEARGMAS